MPYAYPLMLDVTDRLCVIIGGGGVAVRKVNGLLDAGATRVRCVSPWFDPRIPEHVERVAEMYRPAHLDGAMLVFAATDRPEVNEAVVRDARARGILANRADVDDDAPGDFTTPAVHRDGAVTVAVSAGGSPALAAAMRDAIVASLDRGQVAMAVAMQDLRPMIRSRVSDAATRREIFRKLVTPDAIGVLQRGGVAALRTWLTGRFSQLTGDGA